MFRTLGERTSVNSAKRRSKDRNRSPFEQVFDFVAAAQPAEEMFPRTKPAGKQKSFALNIDVPMLLVIITLIVFGLIILYSASYDFSLGYHDDSNTIIIHQVRVLALGLIAAIILAVFDYHLLSRFALIAMGITVLSLFAVLFINDERNNATRTLLNGSIQPSELAKIVVIIYLAVWLNSKRERLSDLQFGLVPLAVILGGICGLIVVQPDISAVVMILLLGGLMFFLAGGDLKQITILLLIALAFGGLVLRIYPYGAIRIQAYLAGLKDPVEGSYQVVRSFDALVRGGWFGVGIGKGETKLTGLPVPHTDSIFAVVGEETGVIGALALVALFSLLLWRGLVISRRAPDELGALLAAGLSVWIAVEAFINMAVMVNLLPFAGNALPFISSGGSNLFVSLAAVGIILNVSRQSAQKKEKEGKTSNAVVDLRGRDRRRRVSSARRPASRKKIG
jgi:cell division protein FtsW